MARDRLTLDKSTRQIARFDVAAFHDVIRIVTKPMARSQLLAALLWLLWLQVAVLHQPFGQDQVD